MGVNIMQINGPSHIHSSQVVRGPQKVDGPQAAQTSEALHEADQLDISPEADLVSRVHAMPDIRADRVESIRQQIAAGTYETEEKMNVALGRLLDELAG